MVSGLFVTQSIKLPLQKQQALDSTGTVSTVSVNLLTHDVMRDDRSSSLHSACMQALVSQSPIN